MAPLQHGHPSPTVPLTPQRPSRNGRIPICTALIAAVTLAAGCGATHNPPSNAGIQDPGPSAESTASRMDLTGILVTPAGFTTVPNDFLSGPINTTEDLRRTFTDHPQDPAKIHNNGFQQGYIQNWTQTSTPSSSTELPERTLATSIVLEFDTVEHASTVVQYFRQQNIQDHWRLFTVPPELSNGYGGSIVQGAAVKTYQTGVAWTKGRLLFNVLLTYSSPPISPQQVISLATAQNSH